MRKSRLQRAAVFVLPIVIIAVGAGVWSAITSWQQSNRDKEAQMLERLKVLSDTLLTYTMEHDLTAPVSVDELLDAGYLPRLPLNPFTERPMRNIPLNRAPSVGNFTYLRAEVLYPLPKGGGEFDQATIPASHYLLGYGRSGNLKLHGLELSELGLQAEKLLKRRHVCCVVRCSFEPYQHDIYLTFQPLSELLGTD